MMEKASDEQMAKEKEEKSKFNLDPKLR